MIRGEVEVVANVPAATAFRFISDPRSELAWNPDAVKVERLSPTPNGLGSRYRGSYRGAGNMDIEVTEYEPDRRTTSVGSARFLGYTLMDVFEPVDGGVRIQRSMTGTFRGPMRFLEPLLRGPFQSRFQRSATRIKEALEGGKATSFMAQLETEDQR